SHRDAILRAADLMGEDLKHLCPSDHAELSILLSDTPNRRGPRFCHALAALVPCRGFSGGVRGRLVLKPRPETPTGVLQAHTYRMLDAELTRSLDIAWPGESWRG